MTSTVEVAWVTEMVRVVMVAADFVVSLSVVVLVCCADSVLVDSLSSDFARLLNCPRPLSRFS